MILRPGADGTGASGPQRGSPDLDAVTFQIPVCEILSHTVEVVAPNVQNEVAEPQMSRASDSGFGPLEDLRKLLHVGGLSLELE